MNAFKNTLLLILILSILFETDAWRRRRRRRRRRCHPQHCQKAWGAWSACNCLGDQTRTERMIRGPSCGGSCHLQTQHQKCAHGSCVFPFGYCNFSSKKCICRAGRIGARCEQACPDGKYGTNCVQSCNCVGSATCDKATGYCRCPVGKYGTRCELSYKMNTRKYKYYRFKSNTKCHLQERISARVSDGINICPVRSHYALRCFCGGATSAYNLFYGQTCTCYNKVPNDNKYKAELRNKYVSYGVCCPRSS